ncbi:MAG: hypothetical protein HQM13_16755 [SAR324 cluster bacterium]|nr:hypothetical protein [SAR324 cluster bacterium]
MKKIFNNTGMFGLMLWGIVLLIGCADSNKEKAVAALGERRDDGSIAVRLSALDIDIRDASQNEEQSELTFVLKISVDNDLCDLVDVVVSYQILYDLNHTDANFAGKSFTFTADIGRIKKGHTVEENITRGTNGPVALDSISVSQVIVRDLQNCSTDPFRPG